MEIKDFIDLFSLSNVKDNKEFLFKLAQLLFVLYCFVHFIKAGITFYSHAFK